MPKQLAVRFRVDAHMWRVLDRLRDEKAINVSAWVRRVVQQRLQQDFPEEMAEGVETAPPLRESVRPSVRTASRASKSGRKGRKGRRRGKGGDG